MESKSVDNFTGREDLVLDRDWFIFVVIHLNYLDGAVQTGGHELETELVVGQGYDLCNVNLMECCKTRDPLKLHRVLSSTRSCGHIDLILTTEMHDEEIMTCL